MKPILLLFCLCFGLNVANAQGVIPKKGSGSKFSLNFANLYFEVDSARGARISSFKLNNTEILYLDFKTTDNAGSTFWPSPQSVWGWPPAANLNDKPYTAAIKGNALKFKGSTDLKSQLRFYKTMYVNTGDTSVTIEYVIKNERTVAQKWAPWEVTRVLATGLTVFSRGSGTVTGDMAKRTSEVNGYVWYDQDVANSPGNKLFCDGKGWIAHVTRDNILFVKKFENITAAKAAPAEAEVEVYTASDDSYSELENQGTYTSIAGKDSVTWKVKWYARELPASVNVNVGSQSLAKYIESVLALDVPSGVSAMGSDANRVKVYPNPATGKLVIESGVDSYNYTRLDISDLQGKAIFSEAIFQPEKIVDVSKLAPGMYFYRISNGAFLLAKGKFAVVR